MRRPPLGLLGLVCVAASAGPAAGQQKAAGLPSPYLQNVFPAGAKAGTFVPLTANGNDLDGPTGLLFSHPGLVGVYEPPPPPPTPADPKKKPPVASPADAEKAATKGPHAFMVTVAANVPVGTYDVRVVNKWGVSNPRAFAVGDRPEVNEKEPNNDVPEAQRVELGTTVNGGIGSATDVDYTLFAAKAGQRVVLSCVSSSLDGRARPFVEVYAPDGRRLAGGRNYRDGDALADFVAPADGDYLARVSEFAYQAGTPDHVYRLTVAAGPWVDAVYPPVVEAGRPTAVTVYGRNLPGGKPSPYSADGRPLEQLAVTLTPPTDPAAAARLAFRDRVEPPVGLQDGFEYRLAGPAGPSNAVPVFFARGPVHVKKSAGGLTPATAEPVGVPCEVVGMVSRPNDRDWYAFEAKKGDVLVFDLQAERIGTKADYYLSVHDPKDANKDLTGEQDDETDSLHGANFPSRTVDPVAYKWTAPFDGPFVVQVGCREAGIHSGPRTAYRLRVGPPRPDFRVVALPYSRHLPTGSAARQGGTEAYDVFVHRIDGFTGAVTVAANGLPPGVSAKPVVVGPAAKWGVLALRIAPDAAPFTGGFTLTATADVDGKPATRDVRPAAVTWGTGQKSDVPMSVRLTQSLALAVRAEKAAFALAADADKATVKGADGKEAKAGSPLTVKQGEKLTVPLKATWFTPADAAAVTLTMERTGPENQSSPFTVAFPTAPTKEKPEGTLSVDAKPTAAPGRYSFAARGDAPVPFGRDPKAKATVPAAAYADPVEVLVIPTALAKVTATAGPLKPGAAGDLVVKVERLYDFPGEFTVALDAKGVTAADAKVPAGTSEVKLNVKVDPAAKPGTAAAGVVRVTATFAGHAVTHEVKVSVNVVK